MSDVISRIRLFAKRLLNNVLHWGPAARVEWLPEAQQSD